MNPVDIKPGQCFRLGNGQTIRVLSVYAGQVRYDIFDKNKMDWCQSERTIPAVLLTTAESCPVPARKA
jgi:hypothetical protein